MVFSWRFEQYPSKIWHHFQFSLQSRKFKGFGMGRTYANFLFSTAGFQVKFYAGRFCAKIFLSSLQSHWLSWIFYADSALSITANIIWFPAKRVTFAVTEHPDNHASGKSSAAFLGFHTFLGLQIRMQQIFVLLYLYGLLYEQSLVTNIASIRQYRRRRRNQRQRPYYWTLHRPNESWFEIHSVLLRSYNSKLFFLTTAEDEKDYVSNATERNSTTNYRTRYAPQKLCSAWKAKVLR